MSSYAASRCQHIKVSGARCGSPALRQKSFCFYHQQNRPIIAECYYKADEYSTGDVDLPPFEDAHSIQTVIRQIMQLVLQKRLEPKTAGLMLYALQIASSNLKRIDIEKPQPADMVTDLENLEPKTVELENISQTSLEANHEQKDCEVNALHHPGENGNRENQNAKTESKIETKTESKTGDEELSSGTVTIQACHHPGPRAQNLERQRPKKQYVI